LHFQKAELPVWSFESALRVAEAYRKSSPLNGKESFYIKSVYEVIISGLLLGSEEKICEQFNKNSLLHADILYAPMAIRNLEEKLVKSVVPDKTTQEKLETSKNKYAEAQKSYNPLKFSTATLAQKQSLLQYIPDDQMSSEPYEKIDFPFIAEAKKKADPKARPLPIDAKDPLFRKFLMQTLCDLTNNACNIDGIQGNSGADMSRKDLLEHMRGPKNHLLLHYGFQLRQSGDLKYPYFIRHNGVTEFFGYDFKTNTTPVDLEEEMRADLKALFGASYPLPPKLIPGERTPGVVPQSELISTMPASNPLQLYLNSMGHPPATR
jgi:hypothetical protein